MGNFIKPLYDARKTVVVLMNKRTALCVVISILAFLMAYLLDRYYVYNEKSTFFRNLFSIFKTR